MTTTEVSMPPFIFAAIAAAIPILLTVLAIAMMVGPFVIPLWAKTLDEKKRLQLVAAIRGANDALGPIVRVTPTDIDDRIAAVLRMVEVELGKAKGKSAVIKRDNIAAAVVGKAVAVATAPTVVVNRAGAAIGVIRGG